MKSLLPRLSAMAPASHGTLAVTSFVAAAAGGPNLHSHPVLGAKAARFSQALFSEVAASCPLGLQQPPDLLRSETLHLFRTWNLRGT